MEETDDHLKEEDEKLFRIEKQLETFEARFGDLEFLLFKSDDKQSRFEEIYKLISTMVSQININGFLADA